MITMQPLANTEVQLICFVKTMCMNMHKYKVCNGEYLSQLYGKLTNNTIYKGLINVLFDWKFPNCN